MEDAKSSAGKEMWFRDEKPGLTKGNRSPEKISAYIDYDKKYDTCRRSAGLYVR